MGFPTCIFGLNIDGPFCPMCNLTDFLLLEGALSADSWPFSLFDSSITTSSPVDSSSVYPYEVGIIAFGVSSPAYPARIVELPISKTRAETSSYIID